MENEEIKRLEEEVDEVFDDEDGQDGLSIATLGQDSDEDGGGLSIVDVEDAPEVQTIVDEPKPAPKVVHGEATIDGPPPPDLSQVGNRLDDEERWYILHTFSGYEAVAEDNLKKVVEKYNLHDRIKEIFIPTEDVIVEKRGKKVIVQQRIMPSYVFIKMIYGDDLWHTITRTRGITGFVGPKGRPLPLSPREVVDMKLERKAQVITGEFKKGMLVQVIDGPLAGQTATVQSVDAINKKVTVSVSMFGRPTTVDLAFSQVKQV